MRSKRWRAFGGQIDGSRGVENWLGCPKEPENGLRVNSSGIEVVDGGIELVDGGIEVVEAGGTRTASGEGGERKPLRVRTIVLGLYSKLTDRGRRI